MKAGLGAALDLLDPTLPVAERLRALVDAGEDRLPLPGRGDTLTRWRALAAVAACDLSLAKLFEGHTDALAILSELDRAPESGDRIWATWAAEAPGAKVVLSPGPPGSRARLNGRKNWCSGAASASHALLTAWHEDGRGPQLVTVDLRRPGIELLADQWHAVGMSASASLDVVFTDVAADLVGAPGDYLTRPGFWQGGGGIAACWYGAAAALADALRDAVRRAPPGGAHLFKWAALGGVDVELRAAGSLLRDSARWIDANPVADASAVALRARLCVEAAATRVLDLVGRALGATPFCRQARFARLAADLPVFMRQSHAERDLAALGERIGAAEFETAWAL